MCRKQRCPRLIAMGVLTAALLSPVAANANDTVRIEVGSLALPPMAEAWFLEQIESFELAYPYIDVVTRDLVNPQRYNVALEDLPQLAENVIGIANFLNELRYLGVNDMVVPVEDFLPDPEFSFDQFFDNAFDGLYYEDTILGVPWARDSWWVAMDWDLFAEEGITEPPRTWDEFADYAYRLTKDSDGDGQTDQYGFLIGYPPIMMEQYLRLNLGERDDAQYDLNFDDPASIENYRFVHELANAPFTLRDPKAFLVPQEPQPVRCAMQFMSTFFMYNTQYAEGFERVVKNQRFRLAPLPADAWPPSASDMRTCSTMRFALAVRRSTPEKEAASWEFVKWINRPDAPLPEYWFGWPLRRDFLDRPDVREWSAGFCDGWEVPFYQTQNSAVHTFIVGQDSVMAMREQFGRYLDNEITLDEMIGALRANREKFMVEDPPIVR